MAPGFNKRKRDYQSGHDFRPRLSPAEQRTARIRKGVAEIGEPSRTGRDVVLQRLSEDLREAQAESYPDILAITRAVVYEQPHKIGYLSFLIIDANAKYVGETPFELPFLVLEMVHDAVSTAIAVGDYDRFKVFLRFLCALAPMIENPDELVRAIETLVARVSSATLPSALKTQLYKTALLAAVYLPENLVGPELQEKFVEVEFPAKAEDGKFDFFAGEDAPFETQNVGFLLVEAARRLKEDDGWKIDFLARNPFDVHDDSAPEEGSAAPEPTPSAPEPSAEGEPSEPPADSTEPQSTDVVSEDAELAEAAKPDEEVPVAAKHRVREIHLPGDLPEPSHRLLSEAFCRIYLPTNGVETVPEPGNIVGQLLRDVALDNIRHMDFNRREVTRQLIALDMFFNQRIFAPPGVSLDTVLQYNEGEPTWKIEDMALEAVYALMFDLSADGDPFPLVYYHTLLVEACVMAPQDIAPVLGRAMRFLFTNFATADAELLFRAVDWFAHHVSNFAFTWKWNEWIDTLQLPNFHPQQVFVRELLAKQVRLSYPQRVRDVLPEEFQPLVPDTPDMPPFKFAQDDKVLRFVDALQNPTEASPGDLLEEFDPETRTDVLITCVCDLGNRSLTHASNWVAKTAHLARQFATDKQQIVESVFAYWQQSQWIGALVLGEFMRNQLVTPQVYVDFIVRDPELLLSSVGWEAINENVLEARKALKDRVIDEEWGEWWTDRLNKALGRKQVPDQKEIAMTVDVPPENEEAAEPAGDSLNAAVSAQDEAQDETDYEPEPVGKADDVDEPRTQDESNAEARD